jgi:riboflavin kinase/FMN adenylyltransferase
MASGARLRALQPFQIGEAPAPLKGGVVAIGNFDGVHQGHVALLKIVRAEAARRSVPAMVLTFEPHPRTVLRPDSPVFRLTPLAAKARVLLALGIDGLAVAKFDRAFAGLTAEQFIERVLVGDLNLAGAVVGFNFRFGNGRSGTAESLREAGRRLGFGVSIVDPVAGAAGKPFTSSAVRAALAAGEIGSANAILGHRWFITGNVIAGEKRGRDLGFPTANLQLPADCGLRHGIYAVRLHRPNGAVLDGVASFGIRPTFGGGPPLLEVHAFDFRGDLYGEEVAVTFVDWLRPEEHFADVAELVARIGEDANRARGILAVAGPGSELDQRLARLELAPRAVV